MDYAGRVWSIHPCTGLVGFGDLMSLGETSCGAINPRPYGAAVVHTIRFQPRPQCGRPIAFHRSVKISIAAKRKVGLGQKKMDDCRAFLLYCTAS